MQGQQVNVAGRSIKLNEATARNLTNEEFLRFIDGSSDPVVQELARRFSELVNMSIYCETTMLGEYLDRMAVVQSELENASSDHDELDNLVNESSETLAGAISDARKVLEDLENAWD